MQLKNDGLRYGLVAQLLHWTIVALVLTQFVLANKADALPIGAAKLATLAQHKSVRITILGLALVRLAWRWLNPVPDLPASTPRWQRIAARVSHFLLYALLLIIPVLGWFMSSARNFPSAGSACSRCRTSSRPAKRRSTSSTKLTRRSPGFSSRSPSCKRPLRSSTISSIATIPCVACCR